MRCSLAPTIPRAFTVAADPISFFGEQEMKRLRVKMSRELPPIGNPRESCSTNLFFGFFFDGTKNNYVLADRDHTHSNVARLYDCFPGLSVPGVLPTSTDWEYDPKQFSHFFRVYVPGVGSPFEAVDDDGTSILGGGAGRFAEHRIVWALLQAINNVHRYFHRNPLLSGADCKRLLARVVLNAAQLDGMVPPERSEPRSRIGSRATRYEFENVLRALHSAVRTHWTDPSTGRPGKIDPGIVKTIYLSAFGFSRGAARARAFANWLLALCRLDAHLCGSSTPTLGGFPFKFDFLGLFDTVASVGPGNTLGNSKLGFGFNGHYAWADAEKSLRVPAGVQCLHLIAAHEIRRSFPVDSIAVGNFAPDMAEEVVFPGVHSDIGCGYAPCEQGRGTSPTGEDMLSRVPLLYMYRSARIAGVPLKLELAPQRAKDRFKISTTMIEAFNAYLGACERKTGSLTSIMREQIQLHIRWRLERRIWSQVPLERTRSFDRACTFDKNDLHSANVEFEEEVREFESWLAARGKGFQPTRQQSGFNNEHLREWEEIAAWWNHTQPLASAVTSFFEDYVHDSRAWFKLDPSAQSSEEEVRKRLKELSEKRRYVAALNVEEKKVYEGNPRARSGFLKFKTPEKPKYIPIPDGLTEDERHAVDEFDRTQQVPRMITAGREPFKTDVLGIGFTPFAGYLRYRKIYGGGDELLLSDADAKAESMRTA